jgi:hypothetical protein
MNFRLLFMEIAWFFKISCKLECHGNSKPKETYILISFSF